MTIKSKLFLGAILALIALTALAFVSVPLKVSSKINEIKEEKRQEILREERFSQWLDKLQALECPNCRPHFARLDSNGEYSYSCLQFQRRTFEGMARRYKLDAGGDADAIYSCDLQRQIATAMFNENARSAANHWYTSIYRKGLGLPPDTDQISAKEASD